MCGPCDRHAPTAPEAEARATVDGARARLRSPEAIRSAWSRRRAAPPIEATIAGAGQAVDLFGIASILVGRRQENVVRWPLDDRRAMMRRSASGLSRMPPRARRGARDKSGWKAVPGPARLRRDE